MSAPEHDPTQSDFARALRELHCFIGRDLEANLWVEDRFFGISFRSHLVRIETLPDSESVVAYFGNGVSLDLAPHEQLLSREGSTIQFALGGGFGLELTPAD
jgi:hypothetical protein